MAVVLLEEEVHRDLEDRARARVAAHRVADHRAGRRVVHQVDRQAVHRVDHRAVRDPVAAPLTIGDMVRAGTALVGTARKRDMPTYIGLMAQLVALVPRAAPTDGAAVDRYTLSDPVPGYMQGIAYSAITPVSSTVADMFLAASFWGPLDDLPTATVRAIDLTTGFYKKILEEPEFKGGDDSDRCVWN